ncbi:MAG TPA: hypothetical protein VG708_07510 [Mycobacteriales bacterium]|nr:hypothetical protein [Mycobacteriales bacterium]
MSSLRHPVGPHPPSVYWVRRGLSLAALVIVIVLIAYACGHSSSSPDRHPSAQSSSPSTRVVPCASLVRLRLSTDAVSYPVGQTPTLIATLTNSGSGVCVLHTAPAKEIWRIVSGPDTVFSTKHCPQSTAKPKDIRLKPGKSKQLRLVWNGKRLGYDKATKRCVTGTTPASPGTYQLTASIGGIRAAMPAVFHIAGS